jgi:tripartite-type tricarboxylate transporter receptor subunit TctC
VTRLQFAAVLAALLAGGASASAQSYPSRPVTLIAPFPAGGPLDTIARIVAEPMRETLGQPIVVENVPGAGGNIGVGRLARAEPDGLAIGIGQWSTHVVNPVTYALPYNVQTDFEPIALLTITPQLIIARKDFPAKDIKDLVAWLKANPDKATAATVGAAGGAQVSSIYFQNRIGTTLRFVPYRGGGPAVQDMAAGQVDLMLDQAANALGPVRSGTVKAYAVMSKTRWQALPDVPSIDESGTPGLYVAYWHAMWAPKGTPRPIVERLNAAAMRALADPAVSKRLSDVGHDVFPREQQSPGALAAYHKAEIEKWWPIVRASGLKAQ